MCFNEFAGLKGYDLSIFIIATLVNQNGVSMMVFGVEQYYDIAFMEDGRMIRREYGVSAFCTEMHHHKIIEYKWIH